MQLYWEKLTWNYLGICKLQLLLLESEEIVALWEWQQG